MKKASSIPSARLRSGFLTSSETDATWVIPMYDTTTSPTVEKNGEAPRSNAPSKTPGSRTVTAAPITQPRIPSRTVVRMSWMTPIFLAPKRLTAAKLSAKAKETGPAGIPGK